MKTFYRKRLIGLVPLYCLSWCLAYILVFLIRGETLDFSYLFEYFYLAWTFQGIEIPPTVLVFSIFIFSILSALFLFARSDH
jgi:hypothetical protein